MKLAVIPARGGSKRIPQKNIKTFCGKPIIAWSIEAAVASGCFDRVVVSTDDRKTADIAMSYGAEAPFLRPAELSDGHTPTVPVVSHAIQWHRDQDLSPQYVCCLYATAPFVQADDLRTGLSLLTGSAADYAVTVTSYEFPIQRAVSINSAGRIAMLHPEHVNTRSQDLPETFHDAGQFYWGRADAWLEGRPILSEGAIPIRLPRFRVQDIDSPEDWVFAETMFKVLQDTQSE